MTYDADEPAYYLYDHPDSPTVICAQWFDMNDYDAHRFLEPGEYNDPKAYATEEEAKARLLELLSAAVISTQLENNKARLRLNRYVEKELSKS